MKTNSKKRKRNRKKAEKRRQILKISGAVFLVVLTVTLIMGMCEGNSEKSANQEVRGVWISYGDFDNLGLYNKSEAEFKANADAFLEKAESYGINTVCFHVRAFRDAAYDSDYFPTASYLWDRSEKIGYDALRIMIQLAHEHDMQLHAWLNPYRNSSFDEEILDPASEETTEEILICVKEITDNYDVDGIHFDDYFYEEGNALSNEEKMQNVNDMVKRVYDAVHSAGRNLVFGISPAGNVSYCESIGADVETWLSEDGYVDYVIPQIYWTDEHTAPWRDDMFTDTLDEWTGMNKNGTEMYIGLAAYKAGISEAEDPGWKNSDENLYEQVMQIREKRCEGFVFFSASDFYRDGAEKELEHYRDLVF